MSSLDQVVISKISSGEDLKLEDFKGLNELLEKVEELYVSPFVPEILDAILNAIIYLDAKEKKDCEKIFLKFIENYEDIIGIKSVLEKAESFLDNLPESSTKFLSQSLSQVNNIKRNPIIRGWQLDFAFKISLNESSKRFKLLSSLVEISVNDDIVFLEYSSSILSAAYSNWQESEVIDKLKRIYKINKTSSTISFELGMCYLLDGLNSKNEKEAISNFHLANERFRDSIKYGENRLDSIAYSSILTILLSIPKSFSKEDFAENLEKLSTATSMFFAWHSHSANNKWLNARFNELVNWNHLINILGKIQKEFDEVTWYEPKFIIENYLLKIYSASRTILKRKDEGGLEKVIQPTINTNLESNSNLLYLFNKWCEQNQKSDLFKIAESISDSLKKKESELLKSNSIFNNLSVSDTGSFDDFISAFKKNQSTNISIKIEEIFERCDSVLSEIADYNNSKVKGTFQTLLFFSLKFLESRMDITKMNFRDLGYLFEQNPPPLEYELQKDYYQFMLSALLDGNVKVEISDISSGRIDVYFNFQKFHVSAEIKRDEKDCSFEQVRNKYLGQSAEYSNTSVKLGFLLVLDLTKKPNGINAIESNVKVEILEKDGEEIKRAIVVIIVPAMRISPSKITISK